MKPNANLAAKMLRRAFEKTGNFSDSEAGEIAFHLTDWLDDFTSYSDFLENPEDYTDEQIRKIVIKLLVHCPDHLNIAAKKVLSV